MMDLLLNYIRATNPTMTRQELDEQLRKSSTCAAVLIGIYKSIEKSRSK